MVEARRERVAEELGDVAERGLLAGLAADHLLSVIDAELAWVERTIKRLREGALERDVFDEPSDHSRPEGTDRDG